MLPKKFKKDGFFNFSFDGISRNCIATHVAKATETLCDFIAVYDDTGMHSGEDYLCTASCGSNKVDITCKDAKDSHYQEFLTEYIEEKHKTVYELIMEDDFDIRAEMEEFIDNYDEFRNAVLRMGRGSAEKTDQFLKQVFFPVEDSYHLLSVLSSTVLTAQVGDKLFNAKTSRKMRNYLISGNVANTMGSRLMKLYRTSFQFRSLPPNAAKKSLRKTMAQEYLTPGFSIDNLEGVLNGMLVDENKLDIIIEEGIRRGLNRWRRLSERAERCQETVDAFLGKYGYESIPFGYELHHIVPIAQSGADVVENLILLTADDHKKVTDKHRKVFKWKNS